ncbi:MAG TPA: RsmE family RNA methyltransferase [Candidatus Acidoferrum sp.]|nr:RsmE family RNA methyltransferase [Candidatus Acidoferrum sp.]
MRRRFFVDHFDSNSALLRGDGADHLGRVLRAESGQLYELSDGRVVWLGRISRVALSKSQSSEIEFELVEPIPARSPAVRIHLLLSITKFDRFEWSLEKATELGASEITPLLAERTDKPLLAAAEKRRARWERILVESAQQCRRLNRPVLRKAVRPAEAFAQSTERLKILLSERPNTAHIREVLRNAEPAEAAMAIGPEGGWTGAELAAARAARFVEASLGDNILRAETAVITALAVLEYAIGGQSASGSTPIG